MRVSARIAFLGAGVWIGGTYVAFNIFANKNEMKQQKKHEDFGCACSSCVSEEQRRDAFNKGAGMYDEDIGTDELVMGLPLIRRIFIGWNSKGRVLEVAAGAGCVWPTRLASFWRSS